MLNAVTGGDKNALRISPAFTLDRRLRLAKIKFGSTGVTTHNTVRACLQPFTPLALQGTPVQLFNWNHDTTTSTPPFLPTAFADDIPFPIYGAGGSGISGQLSNTSLYSPAPGTSYVIPAGVATKVSGAGVIGPIPFGPYPAAYIVTGDTAGGALAGRHQLARQRRAVRQLPG